MRKEHPGGPTSTSPGTETCTSLHQAQRGDDARAQCGAGRKSVRGNVPGAGHPSVALVMRSFNDADVIRGTLEAVRRQSWQSFQLWNFDSSSTDGTLEHILEFNRPANIRLNDSRSYVPGKILNQAVASTRGDIIVFLNSDATPTSEDWLSELLAPFADPDVGAVFGRQLARPDCRSLFEKDTERAFGDGRISSTWTHFFSMANSAVRRDLLEAVPFETRIQYSEDIDWSYRIRRMGKRIVYASDAAVMHSHNYTLRQSWKRHFGEGKADAWIFRDGELRPSLFQYCVGPMGMEVLRDIQWAFQRRSIDAILHSVPLRFVQKLARWQGFRAGRKEYGMC